MAFRNPQRATQMVVKRVVGLPGENIEIRAGDIYINGEIARKSLAQQRQMAIPVYDSNHPPRLDARLPPRWAGQSTGSRWQISAGIFRHPGGSDPMVDWCQYQHWQRGSGGEAIRGPIGEVYGYNQGELRRTWPPEAVVDVLLSCRLVSVHGAGRLLLRAGDGRQEFQWEWDFSRGRYEVFRDHAVQACAGGRLDWTAGPSGVQLEVSLVDRQFLAAVDGRVLVELPLACPYGGRGTSSPFALGVEGAAVELRDVRIARDVYYDRPMGVDARSGFDTPHHLGPGEYFVLGDNSPVSDDSRSWPVNPGVPEVLMLGKPLIFRNR
jgi:signal peptidase I